MGTFLKTEAILRKLRIGSLKKIKVNGTEMLSDQHYKQECP